MRHRWGARGALVVVALVALGVTGAWSATEAPPRFGIPPQAVGAPRSADVQGFQAAVGPATRATLEAPSVEMGIVAHVDDVLASSTWVRFDGDDFELVRHARRTGSGGDTVVTTAEVAVDQALYRARLDGTDWDVAPQPLAADTPYPLPFPLARTAWVLPLPVPDDAATAIANDIDIEVRDLADGGTRWTVDAGRVGMRLTFGVDPDQRLRRAVLAESGQAGPDRTWELRIEPVGRSRQVTAPEVGTPVDADRFDVWDDLPLRGA